MSNEEDKRVATRARMLDTFSAIIGNMVESTGFSCPVEDPYCNGIQCDSCPFDSAGNIQALKEAIFGE